VCAADRRWKKEKDLALIAKSTRRQPHVHLTYNPSHSNSIMSNLWDLSHIQPNAPTVVLDGRDHCRHMFWEAAGQAAVTERLVASERIGHLAKLDLATRTGNAVREIGGMACSALGFEGRHETASILSNTVTASGCFADLAILSCNGVSNGIYPTDAAGAGAVPLPRLPNHPAVCRGR
jgi:hypothetical protein